MPDPLSPAPVAGAAAVALRRLLAIMARLRDPEHGCAWDREQSFATIAPYTIEEAYEVADAIERGDWAALREELGDLLLQVVFHARIAEEAGLFAFADVAAAIADKLEARHPHIFGAEAPAAAADPGRSREARWEAAKAAERRARGAHGALDGVALALPALLRAEKLQRRAARVGFDWPDATGPRAKVSEELDELDRAAPGHRAEEFGDLMFAMVNLGRHLGIDPESALRQANAKFIRRFSAMERNAPEGLDGRSLAELDALWNAAKAREG